MTDLNLEEAARRLVANEVHYCVSGLISAALQNFGPATAMGFDESDLCTLSSRRADLDDYIEDAPASLKVAQDGEEFKWKDGEAMWSIGFPDKLAAYRDAFDRSGITEPDGREIFEHWIVSDWLADKLEKRGESIARDVLGLIIWGRSTTGQAIYGDHIIEEITRELHAPKAEV